MNEENKPSESLETFTVLENAVCMVDDDGFAWIACMGNQWAIDKDFVPAVAHVEARRDGPRSVRGRFEVSVAFIPDKPLEASGTDPET
jgi:hypothetical protein